MSVILIPTDSDWRLAFHTVERKYAVGFVCSPSNVGFERVLFIIPKMKPRRLHDQASEWWVHFGRFRRPKPSKCVPNVVGSNGP